MSIKFMQRYGALVLIALGIAGLVAWLIQPAKDGVTSSPAPAMAKVNKSPKRMGPQNPQGQKPGIDTDNQTVFVTVSSVGVSSEWKPLPEGIKLPEGVRVNTPPVPPAE